jgi:replicative DNA helicase
LRISETLTRLPAGYEVILKAKGNGTHPLVDTAGGWLAAYEPEYIDEWFELVSEIHVPGELPPGEFAISAGDVIFDVPLEVESIWGKGQESLWAVGEPLMIYGPTGIGKTTLAGRLLLSLIGVDSSELLDYPVTPITAGRTVLYIAADRPRQAMRSLRRMVPKEAASLLRERLRIEHNRQIWASESDPEMLYRAAIQANASVVFIDASKDLAGGPLKDEGPAKALMDAIQICIANGINIVMLHHPRKAIQEGGTKRELDIDDVYGSAWLTAGCGSVVLVDGKPGGGLFRFEQLKAPATFIEQMEIAIDYDTGILTKRAIRELDSWLKDSGMLTTIRQATAYKLAIPDEDVDTDSAEYKRVKRHIEDLERDGLVVQMEPKGNAKRYQWYENTL